ncbi:transmembrane protein 198 [Platysternon megacephalum]|uniref:Transmembrane protein 198 n=1 Tax=Platysternon megacephalum TaxID=55544 RepID=A0A4D9DR55_9SAUR|nr:transmembrane protein 198 [Platysternon megacephalum]
MSPSCLSKGVARRCDGIKMNELQAREELGTEMPEVLSAIMYMGSSKPQKRHGVFFQMCSNTEFGDIQMSRQGYRGLSVTALTLLICLILGFSLTEVAREN